MACQYIEIIRDAGTKKPLTLSLGTMAEAREHIASNTSTPRFMVTSRLADC